ncbi:DUF4405 domain-containing protein [Candidatus Shapirobacteria bacterium]|nr:DUF4405 domain-containing protein [Candidatus Shapirobacteria bacterium]
MNRKIINIILLLSFVVCGTTGMLIFFSPKFYGLSKSHTVAGVVMTVTGLIHLILHWKYYKNIWK